MIAKDTIQTSETGHEVVAGWVLYDGDCSFCVGSMERLMPLLERHEFRSAPLQAAWVQKRLNLEPGQAPSEMKLLLPQGQVFGGAEALLQVARRIWWAWPLYAISHLPGIKYLLEALYRYIAARRHCLGGRCEIRRRPKTRMIDGLPLLGFLTVAGFLNSLLPAWVSMWVWALGMLFGFKWMLWQKAQREYGRGTWWRCIGFFSWPGMEAEAFVKPRPDGGRQTHLNGWWSAIKIGIGAAMVWVGARQFANSLPLLAGWIGMVGWVLMLHFGLFEILARSWQRAGFPVKPVMNAPVIAGSLSEFWGRRWNTAFNRIAHDFFWLPSKRWLGVGGATLATFAISGFIHELVISVPARGGYGLPAIYFLIQGLGVVFERSQFARTRGIGGNWFYAAFFTLVPAFWLFHPPFIRNVILPMLHAVGAI